jgi:ubiquinone/menaquinone biosynthesis C-methylase UbiE
MERAANALEHHDRSIVASELPAYLDDLDRLNVWFFGYGLTLGAVGRMIADLPPTRPALVVDVGGGRGDLAARLVRSARAARRPVRIVVADRDAASVTLGSEAWEAYPEIVFVIADATALPFRDRGPDVAIMSLTLHHLEPDAAVASLGEMRRTARAGVVVNDLLRSRLSLWLVWLATRLLARHRFSRDDGSLSVRRAYTAHEVRALARRAGFHRLAIRRYPVLARLIAIGS